MGGQEEEPLAVLELGQRLWLLLFQGPDQHHDSRCFPSRGGQGEHKHNHLNHLNPAAAAAAAAGPVDLRGQSAEEEEEGGGGGHFGGVSSAPELESKCECE